MYVCHMQKLSHLKPTAEVADRLGKSVATITRYVKAGRINPVIKGEGLRGAMWFDPIDVDRLATELDLLDVPAEDVLAVDGNDLIHEVSPSSVPLAGVDGVGTSNPSQAPRGGAGGTPSGPHHHAKTEQ